MPPVDREAGAPRWTFAESDNFAGSKVEQPKTAHEMKTGDGFRNCARDLAASGRFFFGYAVS
jgi:hypothetical protein